MVSLGDVQEQDVFVIGGGPAGLAAGIALASTGFRVAVADRSRPPVDKCCGEGIMPDGVRALARLGVEPSHREAVPFQGIRFLEGGICAEGCFPRGHGLGIRRTVLHELLRQRAAGAGVRMLWGVPVRGIAPGTVHLDDGACKARWIIGADGGNSRVRQWVGLGHPGVWHRRFGVRRHFAISPWTELVEVHWSPGCEAYITPVAKQRVCVAFLSADKELRFDKAMAGFPRLASRLQGALPVSEPLGGISCCRRLHRVTRGQVALIGDASGSVDAITGDGLSLAFHQALALSRAIQAGDLVQYERRHRRIGFMPGTAARLMLALDSRGWLRRRVLRSLAVNRRTFSKLLGVHVKSFSPLALGLGDTAQLLWSCLVEPRQGGWDAREC